MEDIEHNALRRNVLIIDCNTIEDFSEMNDTVITIILFQLCKYHKLNLLGK